MIYIVAHKEFPMPKLDKSYATIYVGGRYVAELLRPMLCMTRRTVNS